MDTTGTLAETLRVVPALEFTSVPRAHTTSIYGSPEADRFMVGSTGAAGARGADSETPDLPPSLPREGYVVWFHRHDRCLGYAWDDSDGEIKRAHVRDPEHAIYFDGFAEAMVAANSVMSPYVILHSAKRRQKPRLVR